ncbi:hypothetical protein PR048_005558 [Dryococelus australis]|uniref:Uncharacterized protein n=1 Tax=Dryococelus australis TaxID=614101 RepID=A0ABQ9I8H5_9NEOP|nr:hypothetical protein PR048_005558 [Dryococelus australis]
MAPSRDTPNLPPPPTLLAGARCNNRSSRTVANSVRLSLYWKTKPIRAKRGKYGAAPHCQGGGNGRYLRNPADSVIAWHDFRMQKAGSDPVENRTLFTYMGGEYSNHYTTAAPAICSHFTNYPGHAHNSTAEEACEQKLQSLYASALRRQWPALLCRGHQCEPNSIPGEVAPEFSRLGIVLDDASGLRVFSETFKFPPPFHFGSAQADSNSTRQKNAVFGQKHVRTTYAHQRRQSGNTEPFATRSRQPLTKSAPEHMQPVSEWAHQYNTGTYLNKLANGVKLLTGSVVRYCATWRCCDCTCLPAPAVSGCCAAWGHITGELFLRFLQATSVYHSTRCPWQSTVRRTTTVAYSRRQADDWRHHPWTKPELPGTNRILANRGPDFQLTSPLPAGHVRLIRPNKTGSLCLPLPYPIAILTLFRFMHITICPIGFSEKYRSEDSDKCKSYANYVLCSGETNWFYRERKLRANGYGIFRLEGKRTIEWDNFRNNALQSCIKKEYFGMRERERLSRGVVRMKPEEYDVHVAEAMPPTFTAQLTRMVYELTDSWFKTRAEHMRKEAKLFRWTAVLENPVDSHDCVEVPTSDKLLSDSSLSPDT